ncbi:hypothetical protein FF098_009680 [Parvularcula flava]|uniref:Uncharacterized protein n=1 Tax=Aquisalinus luteolus TaxID=1566827 RepID=A0A8J3A297_9PROT|nr:hypothetical protein [Aquisalinus luteolus]NHK28172.1 hypothetical protein [Aquisalinus luteolus]GGH97678.1 hypothetical protein GCM10011355_19480 [Aquisalinus luteolus]
MPSNLTTAFKITGLMLAASMALSACIIVVDEDDDDNNWKESSYEQVAPATEAAEEAA